MKVMRNIIRIDENLCNGCGQCILDCAEGAITIEDGKAKVIAEMLCDGLGACLSGCPTGALTIEQRTADPYNEKEVLAHLKKQGKPLHMVHTSGDGCSSSKSKILAPIPHTAQKSKELNGSFSFSNKHWPLKLRLTPADAPFLQNADILLAADCAGFASSLFHSELRSNKVILTLCPKFEDKEAVKEKLLSICKASHPKSITVARMEVPCCNGALLITKEVAAFTNTIVHDVVISRQGEFTHKETF